MNYRTWDIFINCVLPIFIGVAIYYQTYNIQPDYIKNYLPDGLWAYAFFSSILIIWNRKINYLWSLIVAAAFIFFEILQYLGYINGTGDIKDIFVYFAFAAMALLTNKYFVSSTKTK